MSNYGTYPLNNAGTALYGGTGGGSNASVTLLSTYPPANSADTANAASFGLATKIYTLANTANTTAASVSSIANNANTTATSASTLATTANTTATSASTLASAALPTANLINITSSPYTATNTSTTTTYTANAINNLMTTVLTNGTNGSTALLSLNASTASTSTLTTNTYDAKSITNLYNYLIAGNGPILGNVGGVTISNGLTLSAGDFTLSAGGINLPGGWALAAMAGSNTILNIAANANGSLNVGNIAQTITIGTSQAASGTITIGTAALSAQVFKGLSIGLQAQTLNLGSTQTSSGTTYIGSAAAGNVYIKSQYIEIGNNSTTGQNIVIGNQTTPANTNTLWNYTNNFAVISNTITLGTGQTSGGTIKIGNTSTPANSTISLNGNVSCGLTPTINMIGTTYNTSAFTGYPMTAIIALSGETSTLTASSSVAATYFRVPFQIKILGFRASLNTVDSGSVTTVGIATNGQTGAAGFTWSSGTNLLNADLSIATGQPSTMTSGGAGSLTATTANLTLTDDTVIGFFIKSCGSIGKGLKVTLYYVYA